MDKEKKDTGYPWSTYKAIVSRLGAYKSKAFGDVDFNADLAGPVYASITITWDNVFK